MALLPRGAVGVMAGEANGLLAAGWLSVGGGVAMVGVVAAPPLWYALL